MKKNKIKTFAILFSIVIFVTLVCQFNLFNFTKASDTEMQKGQYVRLTGINKDGETISINREWIKQYLDTDYNVLTLGMIISLKGQNGDIWFQKETPITWSSKLTNATYEVLLSQSQDMSNPIVFTGKNDYPNQTDGGTNCIFVSNLLLGTKYYFKVKATCFGEEFYSDMGSFVTDSAPVRWLSLGNEISNTRDIGGWSLNDGGVVRQNMIFRGGRFQNESGSAVISKETQDYLVDKLGVKSDLDLRGLYEVGFNVQKSLNGRINLINTPVDAYSAMMSNEQSLIGYKKAFKAFSDLNNYPIYLHCSAGADRTGTMIFILNGLLGVSYEDLMRDFELTSFSDQTYRYRSNDMEKLYEDLKQYALQGGVTEHKQIFEYWLKNAVGITTEEINSIREILTEGMA